MAEPPVQNPKSDNPVETGQAQPQASFLSYTVSFAEAAPPYDTMPKQLPRATS